MAAQVIPPLGSVTSPSPARTFYHVVGNSDKMPALREIFERILVPLYGSQEKALGQIQEGKDRTCFLLYEETLPVGVIVYKTVLSNEFADHGIKDSIEIKSLFVVNSENNSGRGLGSVLLSKIQQEVEKLKLSHRSLHVTVSETKNESLSFFKRKGFSIVHQWEGKYQAKTVEYLFSCPVASVTAPAKALTSPRVQPFPSQTAPAEKPAAAVSKSFGPKRLFAIENAHWDDIHAIKLLSDKTILTGSKDNSLIKWTQEGQLVRVVCEAEPTEIDEKAWIMAIGVVNDDYWVSGERNGRVTLWNTWGDYIKTLQVKLPRGNHISHQNNVRRVNCIATGIDPKKPGVFIGFPTLFDEYNLIEGRTSTSTFVHKNDWVYCIQPISPTKLLTVTGAVLESWEKTQHQWQRKKVLVQEGQKHQKQRPFISSLTPLKSSPNLYGLAVFDGSVKVFDLEKEAIVQQWREHQHRIWSIENVNRDVFASSGEDRSIKFWDVRQNRSICSINDHIGEVTSLLSINEETLVAGTCAKNPAGYNQGAELVFYDTRK